MVEGNLEKGSERIRKESEWTPLEETFCTQPSIFGELKELKIGGVSDELLLNWIDFTLAYNGTLAKDLDEASILFKRAQEYFNEKDELSEDLRLGLRSRLEGDLNFINFCYDEVTGLITESAVREGIVEEIKDGIREGKLPPLYYLHLDLDNLHELNIKYSRGVVNSGFKAFADYLIRETNGAARQIPESSKVFAYRKGETGDEVIVIFVNLPYEEAKGLNFLEEPQWPVVNLKGDEVQMSAAIGRASSKELLKFSGDELKELMEGEGFDEEELDLSHMGIILRALDKLSEKRFEELKESRQER